MTESQVQKEYLRKFQGTKSLATGILSSHKFDDWDKFLANKIIELIEELEKIYQDKI